MKYFPDLDVFVPIGLTNFETIVSYIRDLNNRYGFTRFSLAGPSTGWRSISYPPCFEEQAQLFLRVKNELSPEGISLGWLVATTIKSGTLHEGSSLITSDGVPHPFANCPLDEAYRERFISDVANFIRIAKPDFVITEDDYSMIAADGCFCEKHLQEFSRRMGRTYTRDEINVMLCKQTPDAIPFARAWREFMRDTLVDFAADIRKAVDVDSPEVPIGTMQSGGSDMDGDCTEAICRAFAGKNHVPFSRLYGTTYGGVDVKSIPTILFHPLYEKQHIQEPFRYYHESDSYPHSRFFTSGSEMCAIMTTAFAYGFNGSLYQVQQFLDDANEETALGEQYRKNIAKYNALHRIAEKCKVSGVEVCYDPFYNTWDTSANSNPLWVRFLSHMGIPYTTLESPVAFWDYRQAKYADHETVMRYLSKGLFLDGEAAKCLCERGYGEYLGADVREPVNFKKWQYDLGARTIIRDGFAKESKGRQMASNYMYSPGGRGRLYQLTPTDDACEIITDEYTFQREYVAPTMCRFENKLGGRIVIMSTTLKNNPSQCLFNYRRQRLFGELLQWCGADNIFVKEAPLVFTIENRPATEMDCKALLSLINLCSDDLDEIQLYLPENLRGCKVSAVSMEGNWEPIEVETTKDGIIAKVNVGYLDPVHLLFQ